MESVSHLPIRNCPMSDFHTDEASTKTMHRIQSGHLCDHMEVSVMHSHGNAIFGENCLFSVLLMPVTVHGYSACNYMD